VNNCAETRTAAPPSGTAGRPSESLTFDQAKALLVVSSEVSPPHAHGLVFLQTGARTEELRSLTWAHVTHAGKPDNDQPTPRPSRV
jgi:hypothetical protein